MEQSLTVTQFLAVVVSLFAGVVVTAYIIFDKINAFKPSQIGIFDIKKDIRRGQSIDWGASNKRKQEIIDSGLTPFNKTTAPDGIEWFIYHEGGDYYKWRWFKDTGALFISNIKYYTFTATRANLRGLAQCIKQNPFASLDYGIHR